MMDLTQTSTLFVLWMLVVLAVYLYLKSSVEVSMKRRSWPYIVVISTLLLIGMGVLLEFSAMVLSVVIAGSIYSAYKNIKTTVFCDFCGAIQSKNDLENELVCSKCNQTHSAPLS